MKMQLALFKKIIAISKNKKELPSKMQHLLGISADSAYRRLRGETSLTIDEAYKLCAHFRISLGDLEGFRDNYVVFDKQPFIKTIDSFAEYMQVSLGHLETLVSDPNHHLLYTAKDIPIFYPYKFETLGRFKIYVWMRSLFDIKQVNGENFHLSTVPDYLIDLAKKQWTLYNQINTTEIWNETTILSLINQIQYYFDAGMLTNKDEALQLCNDSEELIKLIYQQAILGKRINSNKKTNTYKMYFNEVNIMDNSIISKAHGQTMLSLPYGTLNYLNTFNKELVDDMESFVNRIAHKSSLISDVSEKDRNRFFLRLRNRVSNLRKNIESQDPFLF